MLAAEHKPDLFANVVLPKQAIPGIGYIACCTDTEGKPVWHYPAGHVREIATWLSVRASRFNRQMPRIFGKRMSDLKPSESSEKSADTRKDIAVKFLITAFRGLIGGFTSTRCLSTCLMCKCNIGKRSIQTDLRIPKGRKNTVHTVQPSTV